MILKSINPTTGDLIEEYESYSDDLVQKKTDKAVLAYREWRETEISTRSNLLRKLAVQLEQDKEALSRLMTEEMGKIITEGRSEIEKCALVCRYYAENGPKFLEPQPVETDAKKSYVTFNPLGPVLAIMPWNFPFWQLFRFAAPALMAGNVVLLKHAANVSGCARAITNLFEKAGFPDGALQHLYIDHDQANKLIADYRIQGVTLTGSTQAGKAVAKQAGAHLKKSVLELGGSDPYIVLKDAHPEKAVEACVTSRMLNAGQSCIAAKRFIVEDGIYNRFMELFVSEMGKRTMGNPMDDKTKLGPQAREDLRNKLHKQIQFSIIEGAKDVLGCKIPTDPGAFYPASILTEVEPGSPAFDQELFGPVAAVTKVKNEEEALKLANQTTFGLGAALFTSDIKKGEYIAAHKLNAGSCFVNDYVKSDPRLPFGGIKDSGYGRELSSFGMYEFMNIKTVSIE